jgi:NlpC/P60 family/Transglycosylase SLT domain
MRSATIAVVPVLLVVILAIAAATSTIAVLPGSWRTLAPTRQAHASIPPAYLALYQQAAELCPGLPWTVLAAIGEVESDHGRSTAPGVHSGTNFAGAAGPMQLGIGTGPAGDAFWRFAVDGNSDGITSPYDPADAVPTAVAYLCQALTEHQGDLAAAVFAYNHAGWYVDRVLALAASYGIAVEGPTPALAQTAVAFALSQLGMPYRWGGDGPGEGGFDCSGLTHAAYQAAGIQLPRTAQAQYDAGPHLPADAALAPGDLVFFGTSSTNVTHVGIVLESVQMIDAPHAGATVRIEPYARRTYVGATRPAGPRTIRSPSAQVRGGRPPTMFTPIAHAVSSPALAIRAAFIPITLFLERSLDFRLPSVTTRWTNRIATSPRAIETRTPT